VVLLDIPVNEFSRKEVHFKTGIGRNACGSHFRPEEGHLSEALPRTKSRHVEFPVSFGDTNGSILNIINPFGYRIPLDQDSFGGKPSVSPLPEKFGQSIEGNPRKKVILSKDLGFRRTHDSHFPAFSRTNFPLLNVRI